MTFRYKTPPYEHQREAMRRSARELAYGLFMEMGTGKSFVNINTISYQRQQKHIDAAVIIAPNGVHRNWRDEFDTHMPDETPHDTFIWNSERAATKWYQEEWRAWLRTPSLVTPVLLMNIDATITPAGDKALKHFLTERRVFLTIDESTDIKHAGSRRTKRLRAYGKYAKSRRILTGTPNAQSPFDFYSQMAFLHQTFLQCATSAEFKARYGIWETYSRRDGRSFPKLIDYQNLDQLETLVKAHSFRVMKEDCLDLPKKIYTKRFVPLTPPQVELYDLMKARHSITLRDGRVIDGELPITRVMRYHQIACGYIRDYQVDINPMTPRIQACVDIVNEASRAVIVYSTFTDVIDALMKAYAKANIKAARYDGTVGNDAREADLKLFKLDQYKVLVANPRALGRGQTLTNANTVVYHDNDFKTEIRLQSEDRPHRIGQHWPVHYIDLIGVIPRADRMEDTVDMKIVDDLRENHDLMHSVLGDPWQEWI